MKRLHLCLLCWTAFTLLCLSICPVSAQAPTRPKIVFTTTRDGNAEIYVMNTDGSEQVRLTDNPGVDSDPTWSPTGEHIAFVSERDHERLYDIYLMDPDGKNVRRAFDDSEYRTSPTWSPDGKKIAYNTYSPLPDWAVYISPLGGGEAERLAESGMLRGGFPSWSPDGTKVAFTVGKTWRIRIINLITRQQETMLPRIPGSDMLYPAWSPDGKKIAFGMWKRDREPSIYISDRDSRKLDKIVENAYIAPTWSPDGKALLYPKKVGDQTLLLKIDLDSRTETPLARLGRTGGVGNIGWDWFDPEVPPISPEPQLLTTIWGKMKIQD